MIYEYQCPECETLLECVRRVDERDDILDCDECGATMVRIPSFSGGLLTDHPVWLDHHVKGSLQDTSERPIETRKDHDALCAAKGFVHL